jgi:hypothetical protein
MKELNIIMDNCTGQSNKKNYVLHLALYRLVLAKRYPDNYLGFRSREEV